MLKIGLLPEGCSKLKSQQQRRCDIGPGHTVGNAAAHGKGHRPHFSAGVYCVQTVAHLSNCWALVTLVINLDVSMKPDTCYTYTRTQHRADRTMQLPQLMVLLGPNDAHNFVQLKLQFTPKLIPPTIRSHIVRSGLQWIRQIDVLVTRRVCYGLIRKYVWTMDEKTFPQKILINVKNVKNVTKITKFVNVE